MRNFIFRCPETGLNVQGSIADEDYQGQEFVACECLACRSIHFVSPQDGRLMGQSTKSDEQE